MNKPIFNYEDEVQFTIRINDKDVICTGKIYIIDAHGTWEQHEEPSYDILVDNWLGSDEQCLVKHIRESQVKLKE